MKTIIIITISYFLFSYGPIFGQKHMNHSTHNSEASMTDKSEVFEKQLTNVLNEYLNLKDALVASDELGAEASAKKTLIALNAVDMKLLEGEAHLKWMKQENSIKNNLNGIIQMKGIEMKRTHFSEVSDKLIIAILAFGTEYEGLIYFDYCPMANNNEGAYWISSEREIKNPYYGDKMLSCGSIKNIM